MTTAPRFYAKPTPNDAEGLALVFSSGLDLARACLDMGFYVSFSGMLTFKNAQTIRDAAAFIPLAAHSLRQMRPTWPRSPTGVNATSPLICRAPR